MPPTVSSTREEPMSPFQQQVSGDAKLVQRLDRRDVLTDEPRDIRHMGRDHEITRDPHAEQSVDTLASVIIP